jgi:2-methylcitrate dehydratase PrpD
MGGAADALALWATEFEPSEADLELAQRSLVDTVAVLFAGRSELPAALLDQLGEAGRWAALAHVLDFDDLHLDSTTHISAVCVPVALAETASNPPGGARAYLAGAGVMARLGSALGWRHYSSGWHATCTAGAPAAAVAAAVARGLDAERTATAIALAIPAAGGVQRAFGTSAKSLQVAFAADAGIRAAALAEAGATADPGALDEWLELVGGDPDAVQTGGGPAVPGGLAIKLYPCCYALQRPISAMRTLGGIEPDRVRNVLVRTPASAVKPLIHRRPQTGLQAKFSLEYGVAAALLDPWPDFDSFADAGVRRPNAQQLVQRVELVAEPAGDHLLAGEATIEVTVDGGARRTATLAMPPGAPERPPSDAELGEKVRACAGGATEQIESLTWDTAARFLRSENQ